MSGPYLGDYLEDATLDYMWDTNDGSGASITRATDGTISVYKANGTTQSVAGVTDTEDFDGVTGIHQLRIDLSADAFYATANDYNVVLSAATIDGQVVNSVLCSFSIQHRYDVASSVTGAVGSVAGNVDGNVTGTIGSLAAQAKTDVNTEVVDVMNTDTLSEPAAATKPPANPTTRQAISHLYSGLRNKVTVSGTTMKFHNDAGAETFKKAVSELAGIITEAEAEAGV